MEEHEEEEDRVHMMCEPETSERVTPGVWGGKYVHYDDYQSQKHAREA